MATIGLQALGVKVVVVVLRPGGLAARHEVPAIKVEDQRSRSRRPGNVIEVGHDGQHAQAANLLNQGHGVGVGSEQDLFVKRRAIIFAGQIGDDGFARIPLEASDEGQCRCLARLRVHQHLRSVDAIERESGTVDIGRSESSLSVRRIDTPLRQPEGRRGRQIVDNDNSGGMSMDADRGNPVKLTPDPTAMIGTAYAGGRRSKQWRPFAR